MSFQKELRSETNHIYLDEDNSVNELNDDMEASISRYKSTFLGIGASKKAKKINESPLKEIPNTKLPIIQEKLNISDLESQLNNLKSKLIIEKQDCINEVSELNQKLSDARKDISMLNKNNSEFINKLKIIRNIVDNKLKIAKIFQIKQEEITNMEKEMKKDISIKEKEILIESKKSKTLKKEVAKYQKLLSINDKNKESILSLELNQLNKIIHSMQFEIRNLKKIPLEHKLCNIIKLNMITQKNILDNNYQFQLKKLNMSSSNTANTTPINQTPNLTSVNSKIYIRNSNKINNRPNDFFNEYMKFQKNKETKKNSLSVHQSCSLGRNYNISLNKKSKNKFGLDKVAFHRIGKKINLMNENQEKSKYQVENIINQSMDYKSNKPTYLFSKNEKELLNKIIPENYLDAYTNRYNTLESQKNEIKEKFKENNDIKKEIIGRKEMIDFFTLENKENSIINMNLKSKVNKYKKNLMILNIKIKEMNNQLKNQNKKLAAKNRENKQLKQIIQEIQKKKWIMFN